MIINTNESIEEIVRELYRYMVNRGVSFRSVNYAGSSSYAITQSKTSVSYRGEDQKCGKSGIVFYCAKDGKDKDLLSREIGAEVYSNSEATRPYKIYVEDNQFERAVDLILYNQTGNSELLHSAHNTYSSSGRSFVKELDKAKRIYLLKEGDKYLVKKSYKNYDINVFNRLKNLSIDGIPKIYELTEINKELTTYEEYIEGKNLYQIYGEKGSFDENTVFDICIQLCDILSKIHDLNPPLIHRDIKPSNIMMMPNGQIALIDFNTVKEFHTGNCQDTVFAGTSQFEAPEQHGFGQSNVTTDIYGIGATMSYLLTGEYVRVMVAPGKFAKVWKKCISLNPEDRYQTTNELKRALLDMC